jgi:RNA polymerase sigma factor (sigma-70 family)
MTAGAWLVWAEVPPSMETAEHELPRRASDAVVSGLGTHDAQALFGFVRRLGLTDEQADDAVQDVLLRLLDQVRTDTIILNPRAWAFRSIYRLAMDQYRLRRRMEGLMRRLADRDASRRPELADRIAVWAEVDRLPERQRSAMYLRYRADLSHEEIGQVLGITASAVRSHVTQAMSALRRRLIDEIEEM